jgi:cystathionine gamma-lyase
MVWIETPTNPTLRLVDIKAVSDMVHAANPKTLVVVDNTFLSPYFQTPLSLGADIVTHSVTKYLNGHCDVVMGVVLTNQESIHARLRFLQNAIGAVPSPFDCFLAGRGLQTLSLRMERHASNAMAVASYLERQIPSGRIAVVHYPGLKSHPQHALAMKQQRGFGGMISCVLGGAPSLARSTQFMQALKLFFLAESLGGVESLIELPSVMTHGSVSPEDRALLGISDSLIRLSVGIENIEDLIQDLEQAFQTLESAQG